MIDTTLPVEPARRPFGALRAFRLGLILFVALRLVYAGTIQLVPDEATYWVWSRHLAAGYLDHPPVIAWLIRLGTLLLGPTELGVRLPAVALAAGSLLLIVGIARHALSEPRAVIWVAILWLTAPLLAGIGTIFTPDTPAIFFSLCALYAAVAIARRGDTPCAGLWLAFGLFSGLALLSKYTAVLLPASIAAAMLFSREGRTHYRRPWIYLSGILALAVFCPDIVWNARHQWASFRYQFHHGVESATSTGPNFLSAAPKNLGKYLLEQAGVWTPILFVLTIVVLIRYGWRYGRISQAERVLLWAGATPLVFFALMFIKSRGGEANWPAFGYFPASILLAAWIVEGRSRGRAIAGGCGVGVAAVVLIGMHVIAWPSVTLRMLHAHRRMPHALRDLVGWREYGRSIGEQRFLTTAPIVANRHEDAAEASFYTPGQPDVWCVGIGSRPTAYDYFDDRPDFSEVPALIWIGGHVKLFERTYGYVEQTQTNLIFFPGRNQRSFATYYLVRPKR